MLLSVRLKVVRNFVSKTKLVFIFIPLLLGACKINTEEESGYGPRYHYDVSLIADNSTHSSAIISNRSRIVFVDFIPNSGKIVFIESPFEKQYQSIYIADISSRKIDSIASLWIMDQSDLSDYPRPRKIAEISPDGKYLYVVAKMITDYRDDGRDIYRIDLNVRNMVNLTENATNRNIKELDLSDDGNSIVYSESNSQDSLFFVNTINLTTLTKETIFDSDTLYLEHPQFFGNDWKVFVEGKSPRQNLYIDRFCYYDKTSKIKSFEIVSGLRNDFYPNISIYNTILVADDNGMRSYVEINIDTKVKRSTGIDVAKVLRITLSGDGKSWMYSPLNSTNCYILDAKGLGIQKTIYADDIKGAFDLIQVSNQRDSLLFTSKISN